VQEHLAKVHAHVADAHAHVNAVLSDNTDGQDDTPRDVVGELTGHEAPGDGRSMPPVSAQARAFAYPANSGAARTMAAMRGRSAG